MDGRPVTPAEGESAREAALRVVIAGTQATRLVDIHVPSGVILHARVRPNGGLDVLGQSEADPDEVTRPDPDALEAHLQDVPLPSAQDVSRATPDGFAVGGFAVDDWPERDHPWPTTDGVEGPDGPGEPVTSPTPHPVGGPGEPAGGASPSTGPGRRRRPRADVLAQRPVARGTRRAGVTPRPLTRAVRAGRPVAGLVLAGLVVVAGVGGASKFSAREPAGPSAAAAVQPFPGDAPDGLRREALWTGPLVHRDSLLAVDGDVAPGTIAFVAADRSVRALDAATGVERWRKPLPTGDPVAGPSISRVGDVPAVVTRVGDRVLAVAVADGRPLVEAELPAGSTLVFDGPAPLVRIDRTSAGVLDSSGLRRVALPAGARAVSARPDGTVLAAGGGGWWHLSATQPAPKMTPWEQMGTSVAAPASTTVVGAVGASVVLVDTNPAAPRVFVHQDGDAVRASFHGEYVPGRNPTWAPSPSGTWGVFGRTLVDVRAGSTTDLGDWETVLVADTHAYGFVGDVLHRVVPGQASTPVRTTTALVEATTPSGSVVRANTPEGPRFWMLAASTPVTAGTP